MKIRLLSDLHFEFGERPELYKSKGEDVLVIAGDLHVGAINTWSILKQFAEYQPNIVYIMGNHECYKHDYFDFCSKLQEWSRGTSIKFLNPGTVYFAKGKLLEVLQDTDVVAFIGGTLWTNFRDNELSKYHASRGVNDFRLIEYDNHYFTPKDAATLFRQYFGYIKHQYEECSQRNTIAKKVIVTHFLPATECISKQYQGPNLLNHYFANDLGGWIETLDDTLWLFGHTHDNVDITIGNTRLIANPYGYGNNRNYKECIINV